MLTIDGNMDAKLYFEILEGEFMETISYFGMDKNEVIFLAEQ
jgi:hypothetical protein